MPAVQNEPSAAGAAGKIRDHLSYVSSVHLETERLGLRMEVCAVKQFQAERFRATYRDLLADAQCAPAAHFFLEELYGAAEFEERDSQFGRIAGAIERVFPASVVDIAVDLAALHALTESLDHRMAAHWRSFPESTRPALRYVQSWRRTATPDDRRRQLEVVLHMGAALERVTRSPGLRTALKLMRRPAQVAGLTALQGFLERGFDAFVHLRKTSRFLSAIETRERAWIHRLFEDEPNAVAHALEAEAVITEAP